MPFAGVYSPPLTEGEIDQFSIDFTAQLSAGETISSASVVVSVSSNSSVPDAAASSLSIGSP